MKARFDYSIDMDKADRRVHLRRTAMKLPLNIQAVFAFFGSASNLERITPLVAPQLKRVFLYRKLAMEQSLLGLPASPRP